MSKNMSDDEFRECFKAIDKKQYYRICDELENKKIHTLKEKLEYVKKHYNNQMYVFYAVHTLNNDIVINYNKFGDNFTLNINSIDGVLRAFGFALELMQECIPDHAYSYIASKISTFVDELVKHFEPQELIKNNIN